MDFYIRSFEGLLNLNLLASWYTYTSDNMTGSLGYLTIFDTVFRCFDAVKPTGNKQIWTMCNIPAGQPGRPEVPTYGPVDSESVIQEWDVLEDFGPPYNGHAPSSPWVTSTPTTSPDFPDYEDYTWEDEGWGDISVDQAAFENKVCNYFYSVTQDQPGNMGTYTYVSEMNFYLYHLIAYRYPNDPKHFYMPLFTKGNDPAYDRIHTGQIIT